MKVSAAWGLLLASSVALAADQGSRNGRNDHPSDDLDLRNNSASGSQQQQLEDIASSTGQWQPAEEPPAHTALKERVRHLRTSLSDPNARVDSVAEVSGILSDAATVVDSQADFVRTLRDSLERNDAELFMSTFDALASQLDDLIEEFDGQEDEEEVSHGSLISEMRRLRMLTVSEIKLQVLNQSGMRRPRS